MLRSRLLRFATSIEETYASTKSSVKGGVAREKSSIVLSCAKRVPGALMNALAVFARQGMSIHNITNRNTAYNESGDFTTLFLDVEVHESNEKLQQALKELRDQCPYVAVANSWIIPWFPTSYEDLDKLDQQTLAAGADLQDDPANPHPGFHDAEYRARRRKICENAYAFRQGDRLPHVDYSQAENDTWGIVWDKLTALYPTHACKQYNYIFPRLVESAGFRRSEIPQLETVSQFLKETTGFQLRPVAGLLSSRDFLNALAFRVFFSTQYIRHPSQPLYTPEPDVVHELMGHVPLFADPEFADFSQAIGMASLGASDEQIEKLGHCYWFSVEFGMCRQGGKNKAYGAGLLSSFGELQYCTSDVPKFKPWDCFEAANTPNPITKYQPLYFVADDFKSAKSKLLEFACALEPPFELKFNALTRQIQVFPTPAEKYMRK